MEIKVLFEPLVNNYLKSKYPSGIRYNRADNLTIFMFGLFSIPKPGEVNLDHPEGVSILLPTQFLNDGRIFISDKAMKTIPSYIINHINADLFQELTLVMQHASGLRFKGYNACIESFLIRHNIDGAADIERFKKAFYRYRKKLEINLGSSVPFSPLANSNQHHDLNPSHRTR